MNAKEIIKRLKELQIKSLPDYDADEKKLHFKWNLDTPDAIELSQMIIGLEDSMVDALTELEEIKKRAEEKRGMFQKGIETSKGTPVEPFVEVSNTHKIRLIDFIIKGEGK